MAKDKRLSGTIRKNDLEGGIWEIYTADGKCYEIHGGDAELRVEGLKVEVDGAVRRDAMGIGMGGEIFEVASWKRA